MKKNKIEPFELMITGAGSKIVWLVNAIAFAVLAHTSFSALDQLFDASFGDAYKQVRDAVDWFSKIPVSSLIVIFVSAVVLFLSIRSYRDLRQTEQAIDHLNEVMNRLDETGRKEVSKELINKYIATLDAHVAEKNGSEHSRDTAKLAD